MAIGTNTKTNQISCADVIEVNNDNISVSRFDLPSSSLIGLETQSILKDYLIEVNEQAKQMGQPDLSFENTAISEVPKIRQRHAEIFYSSKNYQHLTNRYSVSVRLETIGGVCVEVFTPAEGIEKDNEDRVLINLHGGGFVYGARISSHLESIPIAGAGKVKVLSVDYRMAPEHQFPAASDDVVAVYKALLQDYKPSNIGIYGCSAGALLTTQVIARLQQENLALPGAIGLLCAAAYYWNEGDSGYISDAIRNSPLGECKSNKYFEGVDYENTLAFPGKSESFLINFPPTILMSSIRDFALSSTAATHAQLVKLGVEADLYIWEGLDHTFMYNSDLSESRDAYRLLIDFFNKYLYQSKT